MASYKPPLLAGTEAKLNTQAWTTSRLKAIFYEAISIATSLNFCFLINGLDEIEGDIDTIVDMLQFIHQIARHQNVKIVVSSRPEPALVKSFATCPFLRLQDLTWQDIHQYVDGRLKEEDRVQKLMSGNPLALEKLIYKTSEKLRGCSCGLELQYKIW